MPIYRGTQEVRVEGKQVYRGTQLVSQTVEVPPPPPPGIDVTPTAATHGDPLTVTVNNPPQDVLARVGLFQDGSALISGNQLAWMYLDESQTPPASPVQGPVTLTFAAPAAGSWRFHLFATTGFVSVAQTGIVTTAEPSEPMTADKTAALAEIMAIRPSMSGAQTFTVATKGSIQAAVGATNARVYLRAGNYGNLRLSLGSGAVLSAYPGEERQVVFSGASGPAIYGNGSDCWVIGIRVTNCNSGGWQTGSIQPNNSEGHGPAYRWKIVDCDVSNNTYRGITTVNGTGDSLSQRSIVSHCYVNDNGGNTGIGGTSGYTLVQWNEVHRNNPTGHDYHFDSGGIKMTAGRGNAEPPAPTAYRDIVRFNKVSYNKGPGIWFDWDGRNTEIYSNNIWGNGASAIIMECWAYASIHHNKCYDNCTGGYSSNEQWVVSFGSVIGLQNSKNATVEDNLIHVTGGQRGCLHVTYQNRGGPGPQGGMGIGWFRGTDNLFRNNTIQGTAGGNVADTMYVDQPVCYNLNRSFTGESCKGVMEGTFETQCKVFSLSGVYGTNSLHRETNNHYGWVPRQTVDEKYNTWTNNPRTVGGTVPNMNTFLVPA